MKVRRIIQLLTGCVAVGMSAVPVNADSIDWPTLGFTQIVATTFSKPCVITSARDGSQRLFVTEQAGHVWVIQTNSVMPQLLLDITDRVLSAGAEQGLLGIAFPGGFATNSHFYVDYTRKPDGATVISRFSLSADPNVADTNSEQVIKIIPQPFNNHNGGQIEFGPDGYLYIGLGDGGSEGDPQNIGQNTNTLLGKILRIDVEGGVFPYAIPTNNPFAGIPNYAPEIWAYGLRNPWRFSFDRLTGDLYIGDVGQNRFEEIDFQPADSPGGQNYGWRIMEGPTNYNLPPGFTNFPALTLPVAWYDHVALPTDLSAAVTGGYVARSSGEPRLDGMYLYGDFIAGWIWGLKRIGTNWQSQVLLKPTFPGPHFSISTFGQDEQGRLLLADYYAGKIYQMQDTHQAWTPTFTPPNGIINSNSVTVSCLTPGAVIHFTTNGVDPVESDPIVASDGVINVTTGFTNKARAFRADLDPSGVARAIYTNRVAAPVFAPPAGVVTNGTLLTISTITPGATILFTTNGTPPTTNSLVYTNPILVTRGLTVRAFAVAPGFSNSTVVVASYIVPKTSTPVFDPAAGPITNGTLISISNSTTNSTIFFTVDGSNPTTNSPVYAQPFAIAGDTTVSAFAVAAGFLDSDVLTVFYDRLKVEPVTYSPSQGPVTNGTQIVLTTATPGALIHYTLDGTEPTADSPVYNFPLTITTGTLVRSRAFRSDLNPSDVVSVYFGIVDFMNTVVTTLAGSSQAGYSNAVGALARFSGPLGVCVNTDGTVFVADTGNRMIRRVMGSGETSTFFDGSSIFFQPKDVALDGLGNIYVADYCSGVWRIGTNQDTTHLPELPFGCGEWQVASDPAGNVYVGYWYSVFEIATSGDLTWLAGRGTWGTFGWDSLVGVALDSHTNVYAATADLVWRITSTNPPTQFAGNTNGFTDGPRLLALFNRPQDATVDANDSVYISEPTRVRKIGADGLVRTVAGTGVAGYRNGRGTVAQFNNAAGLTVDSEGNIYVADSGNNCIRRIAPDTAGIGIADDWQRKYFGHVGVDPNADPDHDGMSNYAEFWAGTDPLDASSVLAIDPTALLNNGQIQIRWKSVAGKTYSVQYSADASSWSSLGGSVVGDGSIISVTDPVFDPSNSQESQRYYRVVLTDY